jgi:hypothetical protein
MAGQQGEEKKGDFLCRMVGKAGTQTGESALPGSEENGIEKQEKGLVAIRMGRFGVK